MTLTEKCFLVNQTVGIRSHRGAVAKDLTPDVVSLTSNNNSNNS